MTDSIPTVHRTKPKTLKKQLLRGGVGSIGVKIASVLAGFLLAVVLARSLGPAGYGIYTFALSLIMLLAIPAQVGLPQLVVRETAKAQAQGNWALMRGLWQWANRYVALFSVLMITLGLVALGLAYNRVEEARWTTLVVGFMLVPLIALGNIRGAALRGLRRVVHGQLPEHLLRPALTLSLSIGVFWGLKYFPATPALAMGLHAIAAFLAFAVGALLLLRAQPNELKNHPKPQYDAKTWRKAALPLAMLAGLQLLNGHTDIIMLGVMREDGEVGVYKVVVQFATLAVFGLQAMNQLFQPYFARLYAQGDMAKLQKLVTISARVILLLAIPPVLVMLVWGEALLSRLFGEQYGTGFVALSILAVGQLVNAGMGSVGVLLNMTGHERDTVKGVGIAAVSNILLNLVLIPKYGVEGAAAATAVTLVIWNLILRYYVLKRLEIESSVLPSHRTAHIVNL